MTLPGSLDLSRFPLYRLLDAPAPIQRLERLSDGLGVNLFVKRDDLAGLGMGGNKLRKLEFLLGEATAQGADTIVTVGARQSNHARLTAAAAAKAGLRCELVLTRAVPRTDAAYTDGGNVLLDELLGALVHDLPGHADALAFAESRARALRAEGRAVYVCPLGGSSPVGCLGYVSAAVEIRQQQAAAQLEFDSIVVPNGSGGTHAGLVAGLAALGADPRVVRSHAVYAGAARSHELTLQKVRDTLALLGSPRTVAADELNLSDRHLGEGYGIPTEAMRAALKRLASSEGLFVDPVYGGKAFAGLLHDIETGYYARGQNVLFVMTGGLPGLFAYRSAF